MREKRLDELIIEIVESVANNNQAPSACTIIKSYEDNFADINLPGKGDLNYVKVIGDNSVGIEGVVCFLDGGYDNAVAITDKSLDWLKGWFYTKTETDTKLEGKQDTLVSGTNIKTINNNSLLGSGNITIEGGSGGTVNMVGAFSIDDNGHLIVELPDGYSNPYSIDGRGHLIYNTSATTEE